jgi:trehalose-6-phosphate synthase
MSGQWRDWKREDGAIYAGSRGPGPKGGNGGITAISTALENSLPKTVFVHKATKDGLPYIAVTTGGEIAFEEANRLDQTTVDQARWLSAAVNWFGFHNDWKNCDQHDDLVAWEEAQLEPTINAVARTALDDKYRHAQARYEQGWAAMARVNSAMANVVNQQFLLKPRPIIINDADNALIPGILMDLNPDTAEWILYMHHVPFPKKIPSFYAKYFRGLAEGALAKGIRFIGMHTPRDRKHFGQFADDLGGSYTFEESVMQITHANGRITRLGQTLAGVDLKFFGTEGAVLMDIAELTGHSWLKDMPFVAKTDRMDDPEKNGRRFIQTVDTFFNQYPHLKGKIAFIVIGCPSRQGIAVYDSYLSNCERLVQEVNNKHKQGSWHPIVWLKRVVPPSTIARLYGHPKCLGAFIASKEDGFHLGTVEFVAANRWKIEAEDAAGEATEELSVPGVEWLSDGAGASTYLGHRGVIYIDSRDVNQMARALYLGITMSPKEKRFRMRQLLDATAQFDINRQLNSIIEQAGLPLPAPDSIDLRVA